MHNKFLIFCDQVPSRDPFDDPAVQPRRVWTGSYNVSHNAASSWENAVLIHSLDIANAYAREFAQILAFSERLDLDQRLD